jgi:hypothetical protein
MLIFSHGRILTHFYNKITCTECTKHLEDISNIELHPLLHSLNSSGHGLYKVLKVFDREAGPCWLQCFQQFCQVGWMSFGWWTILDTDRKLLSMRNPAALQFLTHSNGWAWHLLLCSVQRQLNILSCYTYTIHVSVVSLTKTIICFKS